MLKESSVLTLLIIASLLIILVLVYVKPISDLVKQRNKKKERRTTVRSRQTSMQAVKDVTNITIEEAAKLMEQGYELDFPKPGKIIAIKKKTPKRAPKTSLIKFTIKV